jgi:hypothetical protein
VCKCPLGLASKTETSTLFAEVGGDVPLKKDGGSVQTTRNVGTSRQGARKHRGHAGRGVDLKRESVDDLDTGSTTKELAVDEEPQETGSAKEQLLGAFHQKNLEKCRLHHTAEKDLRKAQQ